MNLLFDFSVPLVDPISDPPVRGTTIPASTPQETRRKGLTEAALQRDNLWHQMLDLYAVEPRTDAELALLLDVERTTIIGRRDELVKFGKVIAAGTSRTNPKTGVPNALWKLVETAKLERETDAKVG